ncbi:6596_t:CDS:1, partial [Dentiscutata erythropus]
AMQPITRHKEMKKVIYHQILITKHEEEEEKKIHHQIPITKYKEKEKKKIHHQILVTMHKDMEKLVYYQIPEIAKAKAMFERDKLIKKESEKVVYMPPG